MSLKNKFKQWLSRVGVYPFLDLCRQTPSIAMWIKKGCRGPAPGPVKRLIIAAYRKQYGVKRFIETGTYLGDTLAYMARDMKVSCTSVEIAETYYLAASKRFHEYPNVKVIHGDAGVVVPKIVQELNESALFWLDGHYSGGATGRAGMDTPISVELQAILSSPIKTHVVLIDDMRCFNNTNGYPYLETLLETVRKGGGYQIEVSADIIRLTPDSK